MLRIAVAECRKLFLFFPFGVAIWGIIAFLIFRDFERCRPCVPGDPERLLVTTKLLLISLIYGMGPAVGWAQGGIYGPAMNRGTTCRLTETLPFSLVELNLTRLLTGVAFMVPGALTWIATFAIWRHFDYPIPVWVVLFALLVLLGFQLVGLRHKVLRFVLPALFPLLFIPGSERLLRLPFEWMSTPWLSVALALAIAAYGQWALRQPPPRWAR